MRRLTRRRFLHDSAASVLATAAVSTGISGWREAMAQSSIRAIIWGGPWIDTTKAAVQGMDIGVDVDWYTYAQISDELVPQQKAAWPNLLYDLAASWDPVMMQMHSEGWLELVTPAEVPNLADIHESLILYKEDAGVFGIPYSLGGVYWGYRKDLVDFEIRELEDLLDPRLQGQIVLPPPNHTVGLIIISMAKAFGGDEHNIEPGWEFMEKLARSGNIGRVFVADNDPVVSVNTGETSVGFMTSGSWNAIKPNWPCRILTKVPGSPWMKAYTYQEGFVVFKGPKAQAAMQVLDYLLRPDTNENYNAGIGQAPVNRKAKAPPEAEDLPLTDEEVKEFSYFMDYEYGLTQIDDWNRRWETEIQPLIRGAG